MKAITTYKEHKEKPNEQVQGLGRALAYGGLDYIFNLLKNDEYYSEELEDGIVGIEAYINEREHEIERLNKENERLRTALNSKESIIKEVREYINTDKNCIPKHIKDYINNLLDKENNNE